MIRLRLDCILRLRGLENMMKAERMLSEDLQNPSRQ